MTDSDNLVLQELEYIRKDMLRLARVVESMDLRMKQVERSQATMDMILKAMQEIN